jgi:NADH:ubiquinone oxidoreductase subunit B-like Fe-S oxidoreductase
MFRNSYNWDQPPSAYMNIDAFVPGCPPKPEAIISGVVKVGEGLRSVALVPRCLQVNTSLADEQDEGVAETA